MKRWIRIPDHEYAWLRREDLAQVDVAGEYQLQGTRSSPAPRPPTVVPRTLQEQLAAFLSGRRR